MDIRVTFLLISWSDVKPELGNGDIGNSQTLYLNDTEKFVPDDCHLSLSDSVNTAYKLSVFYSPPPSFYLLWL